MAEWCNGTPLSCTEAALRAALANGGLITFDCGAAPTTILVASELTVTRNTVLDGGGRITLSGGNLTRVLHINDYVSFTAQNLTIRDGKGPLPDGSGGGLLGGYRSNITVINCTFANNDGMGGDRESGGAIFVKAGSTLFVSNSTFLDKRGSNGGAINNLLSRLTVINSTFINNDATTLSSKTSQGEGGAIYTDGASEYTNDATGTQILIRDSTFTGNHSRGQGGAVFSWLYPPDVIVIDNARFISNTVTVDPISRSAALGGALRVGNSQAFISNAVFAYNLARSQGGAFWTEGNYPATLMNITFANNRAVGDDNTGIDGLGGAIAGGNWRCINCTTANNHAGFLGGGIFGGANISLANTSVANNTALNNRIRGTSNRTARRG